MDKPKPKTKEQTLNANMNVWLDSLGTRGLDTSYPMPALGELFSFVTSGFGARNGKAIAPGASSNHEAHDMTVVTRQHYNNTTKYPLLRPSLEKILTDFPGLRPQFDAQLDAYASPDDIKNVPVKSMVGGVVLYAGRWNKGSGESVMIGGDDGRMYSYAHLATGSYTVKEGQRVERGQDIALLDHPTGTASGKCVHVVLRLLPFAGRDGEEPNFKRWSFIHRDEKGFVPASVFAEKLSQFRAAHKGTIDFTDLDKKPGTFLYNENPQVGEAQRPALAGDVHAKPMAKPVVKVADKAEAPKEKSFWQKAKDTVCSWTGWGCPAEPKPVASVMLQPPVKHAGPLPKSATKAAEPKVSDTPSLAGFSPISLAFSVCETVGFCVPAVSAAAPKKPAGKGH